jgi:hypothetical protein
VAGSKIKNTVQTEFVSKGAKKVEGDTQRIGKAQTRLGQSSASAGRSFSAQATGLGGLVGVYAAAAANVFAITAAFDALGRAARAEQIIKGTKTLALEIGQSGASILKSVQEITQSQLTLSEAAQNINIALSAGFNSDQIEALSEVSLKASKALGRNLTDAFQRVVRGASKLEPELLDELGIFTRIDPAVASYASKLNIATNSLTNFEKRQAFVNAIIDEGNRKFSSIDVTTASAQKSLEQLQAGLIELALQFGQLTANFVVPFVDFIKNNAGVALLAFLGILQLVFGRLFSAVGGFAVRGVENMSKFFDGLVAGAQRSEAAMKNVTKAIDDFNASVKTRGGLLGKTAEGGLAGTGGFTGAGLSRSEASDAAQARQRFLAGGATGKRREKDIAALTTAQKQLTAAGKQNTLAFKDASKILNTYDKQTKGATRSTRVFTAVTNVAAIAARGLGFALSFVGGVFNALFILIAGAQLIGTFFDVDLLGKLKGLFFDLSQAAENLKTGLQGISTSAAGGPAELEKTLRRLGATDEDLKNLGKTFSSIFDEAAKTASRFANATGLAQVNVDKVLQTIGSSITTFKESGVVQQQIIALTIQENKLKKENTAESNRQLAIVQSLIKGLKELGGAQEIIGAVSRQLNLSASTTSDIFKKIATVNKDGVIKFKALGFEVDGTKLKFQDLSKESQDLIESNVLAQNTIDSANDAFKAGAANAETLSKKLGGLNTQLKNLKSNELGDRDGIKALEDQAKIISKRVRDLKTLEGIGKALDKEYGKFGNTLDTAVAKGLIGIGGIAKDSSETVQNQVDFLKSAIGFSGTNVKLIEEALQKQKAGLVALTSKEGDLLKNRTKALKAVAGISIELVQTIEKETIAREKILESLKSQLALEQKRLQIQTLQSKLQLDKETQQTLKETSEQLVKNSELEVKNLEQAAKARQQQVKFEEQLLAITQERAKIIRDTENIENASDRARGAASRQRGINQQEAGISNLQAFPNLVREETLLAERKKLSDLILGDELQILLERKLQAQIDRDTQIALLEKQIDAVNQQEANLILQLAEQLKIQKLEKEVRDKQNAIANQAFKDQKANIETQEVIALAQFQLAKLQIEADKKKFEFDNKAFDKQLAALKAQQSIVNAFTEAVGKDSPFVKAIQEFLLERGVSQEKVSAIAQSTLSGATVDFKGLESLQSDIKKLQKEVISTKLDAAGKKFKSTNDVLAEQLNRITQIAELTKQRQKLESEIEKSKNNAANKDLENQIKIKQEEAKNIDSNIEQIKTKYDAEKQAIEDARKKAQDASKARLDALEREQRRLLQLANRIAGVVNQGLSDAINKAFDNLSEGKSLSDGLRDIFSATFNNVRKVVLEETLIKPLQNEVSGLFGGLFGFEKRGADALTYTGNSANVNVTNVGEGKTIADTVNKDSDSVFNKIGNKLKEFGTSASNTFNDLGRGLSDTFSSIISKLGSLGSSLGAKTGGLFDSILSGAGNLFGGGPGAGMSALTPFTTLGGVGVGASGGVVPFSAYQRLASGGMARDRVPALLEPGEFVLKRSAARNIGNSNLQAMNAGGMPNIKVQVKNEGTPQEATTATPRMDVDAIVIDIVTRDLRNNGPIRKSMRGGA